MCGLRAGEEDREQGAGGGSEEGPGGGARELRSHGDQPPEYADWSKSKEGARNLEGDGARGGMWELRGVGAGMVTWDGASSTRNFFNFWSARNLNSEADKLYGSWVPMFRCVFSAKWW
jgi:hypothetical protein